MIEQIVESAGEMSPVSNVASEKPTGRRPLTFINCAIEPWKSPWLSHQPVMSHLSESDNVLYVLNEPTFDDALHDLRRHHLPKSGLIRHTPSLFELRTSKLFPRFYFSRSVDDISARLRAWEIEKILDKLGWGRRVLYLWNPSFGRLIRKIKADLTVFHCHDYYPLFVPPGPERRQVTEQFWETVRRADLVFACSRALYEEILTHRNYDVHLIENGVNFERFQQARGTPVPEDMAKIPRPIVGYVGRVNRKVDLDVMINMARRRPDWSVLLMGPKTGWSQEYERKFQEFRAIKNAFYLEGRTPDDVPRYMNALDVGLMNYRTAGLWTDYGFPLKMFEYFSLGKPVVGTALRSIKAYAPFVRLVASNGEWISSVEEVMTNNNERIRDSRVNVARENSWRRKCELILALIEEKLQAKGKTGRSLK